MKKIFKRFLYFIFAAITVIPKLILSALIVMGGGVISLWLWIFTGKDLFEWCFDFISEKVWYEPEWFDK